MARGKYKQRKHEFGPGLGEHVAHGIGDVCGVVTLPRRKSEPSRV